MRHLIGIDLGTSSLRAVLINEMARTVAIAGMEYPTLTPGKNWAEQESEDWWKAAKFCIQKVLKQAKTKSSEISGIGFSGQMHGTVVVDRKGRCLRRPIPWVDKRSVKECEFIKKRLGESRLYDITGIPAFPGFMLPSVLWIRNNEPEVYKKIYRVLSPKDYLRFRFTGELFSEPTDGCATLLMDVTRRKWSEEVLSKCNINESIMPRIIESSAIAGRVTEEAAQETGLKEGTPVVAGGGDQAMGAIGIGMINPGIAASVLGTGGQLITTYKKPVLDPKRRIHTLCHALPHTWILMGAILSAGLSLKWFRDNFIKDTYKNFDRYAQQVPAGSDGLIFLPYLLGERTPYMNPELRGGFFGITLAHNKGYIIRAIMEGVAFAMKESLDIFEELGVRINKVIASGGGARSKLWRQIQADIYNRKIFTSNQKEHSVYGAAILAGVGTGVFRDLKEACSANIRYSLSNRPVPANVEKYKNIDRIRKAIVLKILEATKQ